MPTVSQIFKAVITADSSGAVKDLRKFDGEVEKVTQGSAKRFDKLGGAIRGAIGGAAIGAAFKASISAASDLEESINAVRVTYGEAADGILDLSKASAESVGLSSAEFNGLSVQFAGFAKQIAGDGGDVVATFDDLSGRAADFASVMNLDVAEAARLFQSGLAGETEPLRRFGIDLSAAAIGAHAVATGLVNAGDKMSEQEKVIARYSLLMESTADTAGDFANTSDSLANSQRRLKADLTNLAAELGDELLPTAASATDAMTDLLGVFREMPPAAQDATVAVGLGAASLAAFGKKATIAGAAAFSLLGTYNALKAGFGDDPDSFIDSEQPFFVKPFQEAARFGRFISEETDDTRIDENGNRVVVRSGAQKRADRIRRQQISNTDSLDASIFSNAESLMEARAAATEYAEGLGDSVDAMHFANQAAIAWSDANGTATERALQAAIATEFQRDAARSAAHTIEVLAAATARKERLDEMAAKATENHRKAIEDLFDAISDALDSTFDYEKAMLDVEDAVADLTDAQAEQIRIQNDAEASDRDKAQALRDLRNAQINTVETIRDAAEAYASEQGAVDGTVESYLLQAEALREMQGEYPHLRSEIGLYIDELNRIPAVKTTQLIVTRNSTNEQLRSSGASGVSVDEFGNLRGLPSRSVGGRIPGARGEPVLMIGHAGETVLPTHQPLPAVSRDGGLHIGSISVVSQSGEVAPRDIVQAIARYERMNGPRYQAA